MVFYIYNNIKLRVIGISTNKQTFYSTLMGF